jgi:hypothetical protein
MEWEPGDLAACYGSDAASRVISWGTASALGPAGLRLGPSHVAIVCHYAGDPLWVESTTFCDRPCAIRGRATSGVQAHGPEDRVRDYESNGGAVVRYRLTDINSLSRDESRLLTQILVGRFVRPGLHYDLSGAILSGTRVFQLTRLFPAADLHSLFCSELVAAVLMRLNRMNHANPTRYNPARLLRELVRSGKYQQVQTSFADVSQTIAIGRAA